MRHGNRKAERAEASKRGRERGSRKFPSDGEEIIRDVPRCHLDIKNNLLAFSRRTSRIFSSSSPRILAMVFTTSMTYAGSLRLPRCGTGETYGQSVSDMIFSRGADFTSSS